MGDVITLEAAPGRLKRMKRSVMTAGRLLLEGAEGAPGGFRYRPAMVTLTYRTADDWHAQHVRDFLQRVRVWARRKGFALRYVWVAELQKRGAVHYHVLLWLPFRMPMPDRRGWWAHGLSRVEWARGGGMGYLLKYATKGTGGYRMPRGLRLHGSGGLCEAARRIRRYWLLPRELRALCAPQHDVRRQRGGGWCVRAFGLLLPPMWGLVGVARGHVRLLRLPVEWPMLPHLAPSSRVERREFAALGKSQGARGSSC